MYARYSVYASIVRGDLHALTISKVSTWAVPATRPMKPSLRAKSFQKPSILSAQAAGSGSPPGPHPKHFTLFLERGPGGESLPAAWALKIDAC